MITSAADAAAEFRRVMPRGLRDERVWVLALDGDGRVLAEPVLVSVGHEDATATVDVGAVFREALKAGAEEVVVAHNHPSGNLTPSEADIALTERLRSAGELLQVPLIDHLVIVEGGGFVSLRDKVEF